MAAFAEPLHERFEVSNILTGEAARRLIKHEHAAADGHGPGDLHHLPIGDRERGHERVGGDVGSAEAIQGLAGEPSQRSTIDKPCPHRLRG